MQLPTGTELGIIWWRLQQFCKIQHNPPKVDYLENEYDITNEDDLKMKYVGAFVGEITLFEGVTNSSSIWCFAQFYSYGYPSK